MKKFLSKYWFVFVSSFALVLSIGAAVFCFVVLGGDTAVDTTSIGYIGFGNRKDEAQIKTYLTNRVKQWQQDTDYSIEYQGTIYKIQFEEILADGNVKVDKLPILDFNADKTYSMAKKNTQGNPAFFNEDNEAVERMYQEMVSVYGLETVNGIDKTTLMDTIMKAAQKLTRTIEIPLHECLKDEIKKNSINKTILSELSVDDVLALDGKEIIIEAGYFSLLEKAYTPYPAEVEKDDMGNIISEKESKYDLRSLTNRQLCILGSGLAKVIQPTSFQAISKSQEEDYKVSYATGSIDDILVYVAKPNSSLDLNSFDLSFVNPEKYSFTFTITKKSDTELEFELVGYKYAYDYEVVKSITELPFERILHDASKEKEIQNITDPIEKDAYLVGLGYQKTNMYDFLIEYYVEFSSGTNLTMTPEEIEEGKEELLLIPIYVLIDIKGEIGYQVNYYRKITRPDGTSELSTQTIYTAPDNFWPIDEEIKFVMFS